MPAPPRSPKESLASRLRSHAKTRWPELGHLHVRFRANLSYVEAQHHDGSVFKLCRRRCGGSASIWGFAIYRASHDDYEDAVQPSGMAVGSPEEALDCACGLYLNDPTAWLPHTPTSQRAAPLATPTGSGDTSSMGPGPGASKTTARASTSRRAPMRQR